MRKPLPLVLGLVLVSASMASAQDSIDFEEQIWPILERSCVKCHKAPYDEDGRTKKPKAGLRFDGAWAIMLGSDDGAVVHPKDGENSSMYWRMTLDPDDDEVMPPVDKADPVTDEEKTLIKTWIDQGAEFGGWAGSLEGKPAEVSNTGEEVPESAMQTLYTDLSEGLDPIDDKVWAPVTAAGGRVMPLAKKSPLVGVDFRLSAQDVTDENLASIGPIGANIAQLDLSKTGVTDAGLATVSDLERLVRLDLHQTAITDAALDHLKGLKNLRYLNLYGTQVTDAGLKKLEAMTQLESLYLWDSKATPKGAKALQKALPNAKVNWE